MSAKPLTSRSPAYFDAMYTMSADPWNFESSEYERSKYRRTIDVLGPRRFRHAFEAGGVLQPITPGAPPANVMNNEGDIRSPWVDLPIPV
jgi:hypothetical protein